MKLPDINVLVYSQQPSSQHYRSARDWLEQSFNDGLGVAFTSVTLLGFLRITTLPGLGIANARRRALDQLDEWLAQPGCRTIDPGADHWHLLRGLLEQVGTAGNLTTDAHLAALALEHHLTLASFDGDFHRFPGLDFEYLNAPG